MLHSIPTVINFNNGLLFYQEIKIKSLQRSYFDRF